MATIGGLIGDASGAGIPVCCTMIAIFRVATNALIGENKIG